MLCGGCAGYSIWSEWGLCSAALTKDDGWKCHRKRTMTALEGKTVQWDAECDSLKPSGADTDDCVVLHSAEADTNVKKKIVTECSHVCLGIQSLNMSTCKPVMVGNGNWECRGRQKFIPAAAEAFQDSAKCERKEDSAKTFEVGCTRTHDHLCHRDCTWGSWQDADLCRLQDDANNLPKCTKRQTRTVSIEAYPFRTCVGVQEQVVQCDQLTEPACTRDCSYSEYADEPTPICRRYAADYRIDAEQYCQKIQIRHVVKQHFGKGQACNVTDHSLKRLTRCYDPDNEEHCHRNCTIKLVKAFPDQNSWTDKNDLTPQCGRYRFEVRAKAQYVTNKAWMVSAAGDTYKKWCTNFVTNGTTYEHMLDYACPPDSIINDCTVRAEAKIISMCASRCGVSHVTLPLNFLGDSNNCGGLAGWEDPKNRKTLKDKFAGEKKCETNNPCAKECTYELIQPNQLADGSKSSDGGAIVYLSQGYTRPIKAETPVRCGATRKLTSFIRITDYEAVSKDNTHKECLAYSTDVQLEGNNNYFRTEYSLYRCLQSCVPSVWGDWTTCTVTCGVGSRRRSRKIIFDVGDEDQPCDITDDIEPCMFQPCPADIRNNYCIYLAYSQVVSYDKIINNQWIKVAGNSTCVDNMAQPSPSEKIGNDGHRSFWQWKEPNRFMGRKKDKIDGKLPATKSALGFMIYIIISGSSLAGLLVIGIIVFYVSRSHRSKQIIFAGGKNKMNKASKLKARMKPTVTLDESESMELDEKPRERPKHRFRRRREETGEKFRRSYKKIKQRSKARFQKTLKSMVEPYSRHRREPSKGRASKFSVMSQRFRRQHASARPIRSDYDVSQMRDTSKSYLSRRNLFSRALPRPYHSARSPSKPNITNTKHSSLGPAPRYARGKYFKGRTPAKKPSRMPQAHHKGSRHRR